MRVTIKSLFTLAVASTLSGTLLALSACSTSSEPSSTGDDESPDASVALDGGSSGPGPASDSGAPGDPGDPGDPGTPGDPGSDSGGGGSINQCSVSISVNGVSKSISCKSVDGAPSTCECRVGGQLVSTCTGSPTSACSIGGTSSNCCGF